MEIVSEAIEYAQRGWKVLPLNGKAPRLGEWHSIPHADEEMILSWWGKWEDSNVGVQLGPTSGIIDIEYDDAKSKKIFDDTVGECFTPTFTSGRGKHRIFKYSERLPDVAVAKPEGLEIRIGGGGRGAQSVFPPSIHSSGEVYRWVDGLGLEDVEIQEVPEAVFDLMRLAGDGDSPRGKEVRRDGMLVIEDGTRHDWAKGKAVSWAREGYSAQQIEGMLVAFFSTQPEPADPQGMRELADWAVRNIPYEKPVDISGLLASKKASISTHPPNPGEFPKELLYVPGFINEVTALHRATAKMQQPVLALGGALALQSTLCARKVRSDTGNYTGMYYIATAPSTKGKEQARKINQKILDSAGCGSLLAADDVASASGFITAVNASPGGLFQIDEFGQLMGSMMGGKESWLSAVPTVMMKMFSQHDQTFKGPARANAKDTIDIPYPCPTLYGTGVPEPIYKAMTSKQVMDGFLSRMIWFEGERNPEITFENPGWFEVPPEMIAVAQHWFTLSKPGNLGGAVDPVCKVVDTEDDAKQANVEFAMRAIEYDDTPEYREYRGPWGRAAEKAARLALIYACSKNHHKPIIDMEAMKWGIDVSEYTTRRLLYLFAMNVSENPFDERQKAILNWLSGRPSQRATQSEITRKFSHLKSKERNEVLDNLTESGMVTRSMVEGDGRSAMTYTVV